MKHRIFFGLLALAAMATLTGCSDDPIVDNPSGETVIYWLRVANAGLTGTEVVEGIINEEAKTVTFEVPAETNIEQIKFRSKLSLNAKLDQETYDFSNLNAPVTVVNVDNRQTYNVSLTLKPAVERPLIESVVARMPDGTQHNGYISMVDSTIYLGAEGFDQVEILEVNTLPRRANKVYTNVENGIIHRGTQANVTVEFMGLTREYRFSFAAIPVFGADFNKGTVYNFAADGGNQWVDFSGENTRAADFDGQQLLIVSREGGVNVRILTTEEIMSGSPSGKTLNIDGIGAGTYPISAGRLSHGHIYVVNLTTSASANLPLKIFHWSNSNANCETVFEFDGTENEVFANKRLGDNISVNLDESGNGYIFLVTQDGTMIMRLDVQGFTNLSNPTFITPPTTAAYYCYINQVTGSPNEYTFTSVQAPIMLMDKDGNQIGSTLDTDLVPARCTDARVIVYDNERYLICTSARWGSWSGDAVPTFYVYSLVDGINTAQAIDKLIEAGAQPLFELEMGGEFGAAPAANTGWGVYNGNLVVMGAATKSGFILASFPERE